MEQIQQKHMILVIKNNCTGREYAILFFTFLKIELTDSLYVEIRKLYSLRFKKHRVLYYFG